MNNPEAKLVKDLFSKDIELKGARDGYGDALLEAGEKNQDVVVLSADLVESTRAHKFAEKFPDRFFEVGVAEQNMMGIAAGLGLSGKIPFVSSYATFSPGRNWDQLRVSVAYSQSNVKVAGAHAGLSVGPDGATHQAMEDIAMVRALPNMVVIVPADYWETRKVTLAATKHVGPVYFRFGREKTPAFTTEGSPFQIGRAELLRHGRDLTIIACGPLVYEALKAADELGSEGIEAQVINSHTIKPLDVKTISHAAAETGAVVTVEEHQITGGLGGAVAEALGKTYPVPIEMVGMPDHFGESGGSQELLEKWGMSSKEIIQKSQIVLARKRR
jgi:transketolase